MNGMDMDTIAMRAEHLAMRRALIDVARSHAGTLSSVEVVAVVSQVVGCMIAYQSQLAPPRALELAASNIVLGFQEALSKLEDAPPAGSA